MALQRRVGGRQVQSLDCKRRLTRKVLNNASDSLGLRFRKKPIEVAQSTFFYAHCPGNLLRDIFI